MPLPPDHVTVTVPRVAALLVFYGALFVMVRALGTKTIEPRERRTFVAIGLVWGPSVFLANWLLYKAGAMSFLPWVNNALHTLLWIGFILTWLYLGVRERESLLVQCVLFATFSLIVKYAEQLLFGTWEHGSFFGIGDNGAYVLGWSLADGTYPLLTLFGLRFASRWIRGLVVL
ncbi:hypothetical protein Q5424_23430 [Conexibacter sp. JD483]|uniref:hypothetical protein n=1 Tax=unclassified Conexibacter TaxID=2627773 RepID=UPI00271ACE75|nr:MULTISPECIES: hypothetical protein [unclassified Conexibacter]MDO8189232.1 hypothetical protein [Conexibacter sp. CPCC 205706]MDO8201149.1 hypothetical protein [Conexibacter sp. CPCC 205762]MDR9372070.1 hypothetical protein [Conexibacter sp. JD483]